MPELTLLGPFLYSIRISQYFQKGDALIKYFMREPFLCQLAAFQYLHFLYNFDLLYVL